MNVKDYLDYMNFYHKHSVLNYDSDIKKWRLLYNENIVWNQYFVKGDDSENVYIQGVADKNDGFVTVAIFDNNTDNQIYQFERFLNNIDFTFKNNPSRIKIGETLQRKFNNCKNE